MATAVARILAADAALSRGEQLFSAMGRFRSRAYAARRIQTAFRRRRRRGTFKRKMYQRARATKRARFSNRNYGHRVGSSNCKRVLSYSNDGSLSATRTLFNARLTPVGQGTGINTRERDIINLRGIRLCMSVSNRQATPLLCNVAIVARKNEADPPSITDNFFRGTGGQRGQDFNLAQLDASEFHCYPLNTDKFHVFWHKRFKLQNVGGSTYNTSNSKSYIMFKKYLKIKRQVRYQTSAGTSEEVPVRLLYWFDQIDSPANTAIVTGACFVQSHAIMYFRDTRN